MNDEIPAIPVSLPVNFHSRSKHLQWCKQRALQYCNMGDANQAFASFISDMRKHTETASHAALGLMIQMKMGGFLNSVDEMRKFIEGFN